MKRYICSATGKEAASREARRAYQEALGALKSLRDVMEKWEDYEVIENWDIYDAINDEITRIEHQLA